MLVFIEQLLSICQGSRRNVASAEHLGDFFYALLLVEFLHVRKSSLFGFFFQNLVMMGSHGAAINVLLAGLTNHEIGTGKTRLYNGAINVIEGSQTGGFHVLHCNLPPDDPKTRQILLQDR